MPEMKTLGGYEVVDAKAREDIEALKNTDAPGNNIPVYTIKVENDACVTSRAELKEIYDKVMSGERILCYWSCSEGIVHTRVFVNNDTSTVVITPCYAYTKENEIRLISGQMNITSNSTMYIKTTNNKTAPTKKYVDDIIAALEARIAVLEGGNA